MNTRRMSLYNAGGKRALDLCLALIALVVLFPLLGVLAALVKATSSGPVLFCHLRVGRDGRPFKVLKFRTMVQNAESAGPPLTAANDSRITRFGRVLRNSKLDELPQLANVLRGDMSIVGPRPEAPVYVGMFDSEFRDILRIRPGITDLASIAYRHEAKLLAESSDPASAYVTDVLPAKLLLARDYVKRQSLPLDMRIIVATVAVLFSDAAAKRLLLPGKFYVKRD
jgi:lipopolysaccharide/colanic/teichoic acid biosynthesis glycosyltransferase